MTMYAVKEMFATLQGEGYWTGTPALFVRFAGCNLWSGREQDRERDSARNGADCPRWCDTEFTGGRMYTCSQIRDGLLDVAQSAGMSSVPLIVFTGGEPLLQLTTGLCEELTDFWAARLAVETNGTVPLSEGLRSRLWVTVSPKVEPSRIKVRYGNELKVIMPGYDPMVYRSTLGDFEHYFVQAQGHGSILNRENQSRAVAYVQRNPGWRLSVQAHKILNIP
jgi:organic radical activating enzyme